MHQLHDFIGGLWHAVITAYLIRPKPALEIGAKPIIYFLIKMLKKRVLKM